MCVCVVCVYACACGCVCMCVSVCVFVCVWCAKGTVARKHAVSSL